MHQKERLFGWAGTGRDREADKSYLFLGRPEAVESLCSLGLEHNFNIYVVVADESNKPHGDLDPSLSVKAYDYVIYDTGAYSYEKMLYLLSLGAGHTRIRIATYSMDTSKLITMNNVY